MSSMDWQGSRVEMVKADGWAVVGWTGIVIESRNSSVVVRWDNGKRYAHRKKNLKMVSITSCNDPNTAFKFRMFQRKH